jgi:DNA polymerase III sliding clamp (beta) subunit (PCNA family)
MQSFILSKDLLDKVSQFSAKESIRPSLAWVYVQIDDDWNITLASTDSYRLHELKWWELKGRFPDYKAFFDKSSDPINIDSEWMFSLIANCKQAISIDKNSYVRLWDWFCYVGSAIPSKNEYEEIKLPSSYQFKLPHTVKINTKYLLEMLKTIPTHEQVTVRNRNPLASVNFQWNDNWVHTHLIMPLK